MQDSGNAATSSSLRMGQGVTVARKLTKPGVHPFDAVEWEIRDAVIGDAAKPAFEQRGVEFPASWSQNATNIVAQKYFRGRLGSAERESSVKQMIGRVAGTIAGWGRELGYFATDEDGDAFEAELTHILLHQMAAFNSPVWFNVGFEESPQCSACFILSVEDNMESILEWNTKEGMIFRGGSGSGINLSKIRGSMEPLAKGGTASGPGSFMRGADRGCKTDTTINQRHTCPNSGRINASKPCFPADARVHTTKGLLSIAELVERGEAGEDIRVYTHRATAHEPGEGVIATQPVAFMRNGVSPIVRLR